MVTLKARPYHLSTAIVREDSSHLIRVFRKESDQILLVSNRSNYCYILLQ